MIEIDPLKQSKLIESDVNVSSQESQLKSFLQLFTGFLVGLIILVSSVFLIADLLVTFMPDAAEDKIHLFLADRLNKPIQSEQGRKSPQDLAIENYLLAIVNKLKVPTRLASAPITIELLNSQEINAFAAPGYRLYVTNGFYNSAGSENELAMILSHELGHLDLRHTFKKTVRNLSVLLLSFILSQEQALSLAENITNSIALGYSRKQEDESDFYAIDLYSRVYDKNSSEALRFYERMSSQEGLEAKATAYFSTHPLTTKRLKLLKERARELGMEDKGIIRKKILKRAVGSSSR